MSGKKKDNNDMADDGQRFMQRMQANLAYFKRHHPSVYRLLSVISLENVELVVTPGADDVDMVAHSHSCYRGLAREYSLDEAASMLAENPPEKPIRTFAPPSVRNYKKKTFANRLLQEIVLASPMSERPFTGYIRGNFFPSIVFLGTGLAYHIEWLVQRETIVNAIIIERDPEKFAVSLYTVDWESICNRFAKKGHSLTFAIGRAETSGDIRALVSRNMTKDVPFYPFFSTYYNHLADVELARGVLDTAKDLSVISTNWIDYDNDMVRLKNTLHNVRRGIRYVARQPESRPGKPVVVVGSGPSLDQRIDDIKAVRDKVTIISAGTALRSLLAAGIIPDFQMELDPGYIVYEFHKETDRSLLKQITLLAVNEVNPRVPDLFGETVYFLKTDNAFAYLLGVEKQTFRGCNPTVTNAALAFAHAMGAPKIYLFGTDYGFESEDKDHADHSVWGKESDTVVSRRLRERRAKDPNKRKIIEVPSVKGGTIQTLSAYYSAKRSVEELITLLKNSQTAFSIYNCADGAIIEGTEWLTPEQFFDNVKDDGIDADLNGLDREALESTLESLVPDALDAALPAVAKELRRICSFYARLVKASRLKGRRDLCTTVNEIRQSLETVKPIDGKPVTREQVYVYQLIKGSVQHFLYVGLCHGMACKDEELVGFLGTWKEKFLIFLDQVFPHFERTVYSDLSIDQDPWTLRTLYNADPEFDGEMPFDPDSVTS